MTLQELPLSANLRRTGGFTSRSIEIFFIFYFFIHTAFKLSSLWHVGYVLDDFYGF
jgi:hypothetical protein